MVYWAIMIDSDGESEAHGPFADYREAEDHALCDPSEQRWIDYEIIQEEVE